MNSLIMILQFVRLRVGKRDCEMLWFLFGPLYSGKDTELDQFLVDYEKGIFRIGHNTK